MSLLKHKIAVILESRGFLHIDSSDGSDNEIEELSPTVPSHYTTITDSAETELKLE